MNESLQSILDFQRKHSGMDAKIVSFINERYGMSISSLLQINNDDEGEFVSPPISGWPEDDGMATVLEKRKTMIFDEVLDAIASGQFATKGSDKPENPFKDAPKPEPRIEESVEEELPLDAPPDDGEDNVLSSTDPSPAPTSLADEITDIVTVASIRLAEAIHKHIPERQVMSIPPSEENIERIVNKVLTKKFGGGS